MVPDTVSHYRVVRKVGGGGMGVVYEAVDHQLGRRVAIKFLTPDVAGSSHAVTRLRREARAASALSHPNICTVYEFGEHDGKPFIVFELLDGTTLGEMLGGRPLPLDAILEFGVQVASALECAHHAGFVHRDIKPGNLFVTGPHQIKVLDFGLAKPTPLRASREGSAGSQAAATASRDPITEHGMAVGTAPYMSPEQALGDEVDHRTDIFSLGAVLFEMATGQQAFGGSTQTAIHDAVLHRVPPPASRLNPAIPASLDGVIAKALEKDREYRYQAAAEVRVDLQRLRRDMSSGHDVPAATWPAKDRRGSKARRLWMPIGLSLVALAAALAAYFWPRPEPPDPFTFAERRQLTTTADRWEGDPAVSPDGSLVAYTSNESGNADIWVIGVGASDPVQLTTHPAADREPAWFPDGSAILFTSERSGRPEVWRTPWPKGAASLFIPDAAEPSVSSDGQHVAFVRETGESGFPRVFVAPVADVSRAVQVTTDADGRWRHGHPAWSPDGRSIAYRAQNSLWVKPFPPGPAARAIPLLNDGFRYHNPAWSPDGRWIYVSSDRDGTFSLWRIASSGGQPTRVAPDARHPSLSRDGARLAFTTLTDDRNLVLHEVATGRESVWGGTRKEFMPVFSPDGATVFFASDRETGRDQLWMISRTDARWENNPRRLTDLPGAISHPTCAPDGRRVAFFRVIGDRREIWAADVAGGPAWPVTNGPNADIHPAWSPLGDRIAFASERGGKGSHIWVARLTIDGRPVGEPEQMTRGPVAESAPAWSPDGKWIAYVAEPRQSLGDILIVASDGKSPPVALTRNAAATRAEWSPDGKSVVVCARWGGPALSLRAVDVATRAVRPFQREIVIGQNLDMPDFDMSRDGHWVVFGRDEARGDIWLLDKRSTGR